MHYRVKELIAIKKN